jgi:hypothetical protein
MYPLASAVPILLLAMALPALADDSKRKGSEPSPQSAGQLTSRCHDRSFLATLSDAERDRFCRWVVRFRKSESGSTVVPATKSEDQTAVETALGGLVALQPAQVEGDRASVLAQRGSGELVVVFLERRDGVWATRDVKDAPSSGASNRTR